MTEIFDSFASRNSHTALVLLALTALPAACAEAGETAPPPAGTGGKSAQAGSGAFGGAKAFGGASAGGPSFVTGGSAPTSGGSSTATTGGTPSGSGGSGGSSSLGGSTASAGSSFASGGVLGTGGTSIGGNLNSGGSLFTGGSASKGGSAATGGFTATGGATATGGGASKGGSAATGGSTATGGSAGKGGSASTGGAAATGGSVSMGTCTGNSTVNTALVGYATLEAGTTGGKGGARVTASTGAEIMAALKTQQDSATPLTIVVSGIINLANSGGVDKIDVKDVRNVSIIGAGAGAEFDGIGIKVVRAGNIVLRNLRIHHVLSGDKDAISIEGPADHVWVDHCELYNTYQGADKDYYDGLLDAKAETEYLTYSWNYFHDSWKTSLVGSSETDAFDRKLTMHHNYFKNCNSRLPLFRGGSAHVFNNYYQDIVETAINSRLGACVQVENNYFSNVQNPWVSAFSATLGGGEIICNIMADGSAFTYSASSEIFELPACTLDVPYDHSSVLNATAEVPAIVMANAGVGKLANPETF